MRAIFGAFGGGKLAAFAGGRIQREQIVVEELIVVLRAIGDVSDLPAVGRPIDGMLVVDAVGELARFSSGDIDDENMQALVVVEMRVPFRGGRLIEVTGDDDGVAGGIGGFRSRRGRHISDLFAIGRPGGDPAGGGQWSIGLFQRTEISFIAAVRPGDNQPGFIP